MSVVDCSFDHPLKLEEEATIPLAGGIANQGYQCGMLGARRLPQGHRRIDFLARARKLKLGQLLQHKGLWNPSVLATTILIASK
jgi:hypothetical protein